MRLGKTPRTIALIWALTCDSLQSKTGDRVDKALEKEPTAIIKRKNAEEKEEPQLPMNMHEITMHPKRKAYYKALNTPRKSPTFPLEKSSKRNIFKKH